MKVLIGTKNPGKIKGAKMAFDNYFNSYEIDGINVPSEVSDQPINDDTYLGAYNRVKNVREYARQMNIRADYYVAIESGLVKMFNHYFITNVAVISDNKGYISVGNSASFPVPEKYVKDITKRTLGKVMDEIFNESDLRSSTGGIGILTHDKITRIDLNYEAFTMALTQFVNGNVWKD